MVSNPSLLPCAATWASDSPMGVVLKSGQHAKLMGIRMHASFVLLQTLTPDLQK